LTHNETHALYLIEIFSSGGCIAVFSKLYPKAVLLIYSGGSTSSLQCFGYSSEEHICNKFFLASMRS